MENISPTRMNLLQRRGQITLAFQGVDLLKRKRDALIADFFSMVRSVMEKRNELDILGEQAYLFLALSKALSGSDTIRALVALGARQVGVEIDSKNIWGVKVPEIRTPPMRRGAFERGWNPQWQSPYLRHAADDFEILIEKLIDVAAQEVRIRKMGSEIKKTTRRVNALEQVVIPRLSMEIGFIKSVLEQREREDMFRLKRLKGKRDRTNQPN